MLALEKYLPLSEKALFDEFSAVYENLAVKNQKEKQAYQDKSGYYRDYARSWREQNPERQKEYAHSHYQKKKEQAKQKK